MHAPATILSALGSNAAIPSEYSAHKKRPDSSGCILIRSPRMPRSSSRPRSGSRSRISSKAANHLEKALANVRND